MKTKFNDIGRCLICLHNPCDCGKPKHENWKNASVKCECLNCGNYQYIEEGQFADCESCGISINSKEDIL